MSSDDPLAAIKALVGAVEQQSALCVDLLEVAKLQRRRIDELEENYADLVLEVGRMSRRARLLVNMKAATLTSTCTKCGAEFATEAGPLLCGPCWVEAGRPSNGLHAV